MTVLLDFSPLSVAYVLMVLLLTLTSVAYVLMVLLLTLTMNMLNNCYILLMIMFGV
jgi:hypothetical protein